MRAGGRVVLGEGVAPRSAQGFLAGGAGGQGWGELGTYFWSS